MTGVALQIALRYYVEDVDRYGNARGYVRVPGRRKVRIRALPGTAEFMEAYREAIDGVEKKPRAGRVDHGSFQWLCNLFYGSNEFTSKDVSTRSWMRRALESISAKHGSKPARLMEARHVRKIRDERKDHPSAANHRMKALRRMFGWAVEEDHVPADPTLGVKGLKYVAKGHPAWTPDDIKAFDKRHPLGTKARLAKDLLRYTSGRREDAVRLGPQHIRNGRIKFTQAKNEHIKPVNIDIPLHPKLAASIRACRPKHLTFLVTEYGKPFTPAGFGGWFRARCDEAELTDRSAHGLRKRTLAEIAEQGGTAHMIMSVGGHETLEEVENYTKSFARAKLATKAMRKLK